MNYSSNPQYNKISAHKYLKKKKKIHSASGCRLPNMDFSFNEGKEVKNQIHIYANRTKEKWLTRAHHAFDTQKYIFKMQKKKHM